MVHLTCSITREESQLYFISLLVHNVIVSQSYKISLIIIYQPSLSFHISYDIQSFQSSLQCSIGTH